MEDCTFSFEPVHGIDFWALPDSSLSDACVQMANENFEGIPGELRAEARRMLRLWNEALEVPDELGQQRARRNSLIAGLRKRTIQMLVSVSMQVAPAIPEC